MPLRFARGDADRLETLHPAYFALVMATGIVALALGQHGMARLARVLFWLNLAQAAALAFLFGLRLRYHLRVFVADLSDHARGVGFFTWVAAPGVLGAQVLLQVGQTGLAVLLWGVAALAWALTTYGVLAAIMLRSDKPAIADGLNGGWLIAVVATQSLSILTALLAGAGVWGGRTQAMLFAALALWLAGGVLYLWVTTLIFLRYSFLRLAPADLTPPYWINMGAVAISAFAGAVLIRHAALSPVIAELAVFVKGGTLLCWAVATWWIPMLLVLGVWRYVLRGVPFAYDPLYWGAVFPLGMYSVCTTQLDRALPVSFLGPVGAAFALLAGVAWMLTFLAMIESVTRSLRHEGGL